MKTFIKVFFCSIVALFSFSGSILSAADLPLPPGVMNVPPDKIKWEKTPSGREQSFLMGNPNKPGPYLYLVKWEPNDKAYAHKHPEDRYGMVISGLHYIGYDTKFDESKLHAHPVGSYFTEPANTAHFGKTTSEGAILLFYGIGPTGSTPLEKDPRVSK